MVRSRPPLRLAVGALALAVSAARAEAPACPASAAEIGGKGIKEQIAANTRGGVLDALRALNDVFKACAALRRTISDQLMAIVRNGSSTEEEAAVYTLANLQLSWQSTGFEADKQHLYAAFQRLRGPEPGLAALYDKALMNAAGLYRDAAHDFEKRFDPEMLAAAERGLGAVVERYPESAFADDAAFLLASFELRAAIRAMQAETPGEEAARRLAAAIKHYELLAADYEAFLKDPAAKPRFLQPAPMAMPALYHLALAHAMSGNDAKASAALKRVDAVYEQSLGESRRIVYAYSIYFYRILWLDQPAGSPPPLNARVDAKFMAERTAAALPQWHGKLGAYAGLQQFARVLEGEARQARDFGVSLGQFEAHADAKAFVARIARKLAEAQRERPDLAALKPAIFQPSGEAKSFTVILRPLTTREQAVRLLEQLRGVVAGAEVGRVL